MAEEPHSPSILTNPAAAGAGWLHGTPPAPPPAAWQGWLGGMQRSDQMSPAPLGLCFGEDVWGTFSLIRKKRRSL